MKIIAFEHHAANFNSTGKLNRRSLRKKDA